MDIKQWIGYTDNMKIWRYNFRDVVLFNVACGSDGDDMEHVFSKHPAFRANPVFSCLPVFGGGAGALPNDGLPSMKIQMAYAGENGAAAGLDWDQHMYFYRPVDPIKGAFIWHNVCDHIYDRGPGKGVVISNDQLLMDEAGREIGRNISRTVLFGEGGFGGEPVPPAEAVFPNREPDYVETAYIDNTAHVIYTLCADIQADIHIDKTFCVEKAHQPDVIVQGHLTLGNACRMAIHQIIPGQDERVTHLYAQFRNPLFPRQHIQFRGWKAAEGKVYFKVVNIDDHDKIILNNGVFEWK